MFISGDWGVLGLDDSLCLGTGEISLLIYWVIIFKQNRS